MSRTKVKRIDMLTAEQSARMDEWADKWIEIGLRTDKADRETFELAAKECYKYAGIPWPNRVVWVSSPLVAAIAAPVASLLIQYGKRRAVVGAVRDSVRDAIVDTVVGAVRDAVVGAVRDAVDDSVRDAVEDSVRDAVSGAVGNTVVGAVDDSVRDAVRDAVSGAVGNTVVGALGGAVCGAVGNTVVDAVDDSVRDAVSGAVGNTVVGAVDDSVRDAVSGFILSNPWGSDKDAVDDEKIRKVVADVIRRGWSKYIGGQLWIGGWWWGSPFTSFFRDVCSLDLDGDLWQRGIAYEKTMQSACWWYPYRDFVMVSERPTVINRELTNQSRSRGWGSHRIHCIDGPAIAWTDGWGVYAVHGVRVPADIIENRSSLTIDRIKKEKNAEVRRVMIELFGEVRYVEESGMKPVAHDDKYGTIYFERTDSGRPICRLRVVNRTAEPDGSFRIYWLPINPDLYAGDAGRVPQAAAASTWRTTPEGKELMFSDWRDYRPAIET